MADLNYPYYQLFLKQNGYYEGEYKDGYYHGYGIFHYMDGSTYEGNFLRGERHGQGKMKYANGTIYLGLFNEDICSGKGIIKYPNGVEYEGNFEDDLPNGYGHILDSKNNKYQGLVKNGKPWGKGEIKYSNGSTYKGDFVDGKKEGKGKYKSYKGLKYSGLFKNNLYHGKGTLINADGEKYTGNFQSGEYNGKGKLIRSTQSYYEGDFLNGEYHGFGIEKIGNTIYEGNFQKGKKEGTGTLKTLFQIYTGEFKNNSFNGRGVLEFTSQGSFHLQLANPLKHFIRYEGEFKEGLFHGNGKSFFFDGRIEEGFYKNGIYIGSHNHEDKINHLENETVKKAATSIKMDNLSNNSKYLFFDTETTGLPENFNAPLTDFANWPRMVQLAYILCDGKGNEITRENFIIKPEGFTIPLKSTGIHRITHNYAMQNGVTLAIVLNHFQTIIQMADIVIAHNLEFDEKIVGAEFLRTGMKNHLQNKRKLCTQLMTTNFCAINTSFGYKWPSLGELHFKLFNKDIEDAHDALKDVEATAKCFWELKKRGIIL